MTIYFGMYWINQSQCIVQFAIGSIVISTNIIACGSIENTKKVVDKCKEVINTSTLANNQNIFLTMDNLYYRLLNKCEKLEAQIKLKLQMVDKQKVLALYEQIKDQYSVNQEETYETLEKPRASIKTTKFKSIATDLYDEEDSHEIDITEDDDSDAEDEIIIDDEDK